MNQRSRGVSLLSAGSRSGVSLVELMIAVAVMSIGILSLIASFGSIQRGLQLSKNKTLASGLAQEKMQILKQKSYYQVIATPAPSGENTEYTPSIPYDTVYFPSENILEGGVRYTRLTYVQVVRENSGTLEYLAPDIPDTGMRMITVTVLWTEGSTKKKIAVNSIMANPDTVMSSSFFQGYVRKTAGVIPGALVNVAENMGWRDTANGSGFYSIGLSPGNYTLMATAPGYYSQFQAVSISAGATTNLDFTLQAIASGTVSGTAWVNPGLLVSQVVTSTVQENGYVAQYIELFNPTTSAITIGGDPPPIKVNFAAPPGCTNADTCADATYGIKLVYVNNTVASHGYYVVANTTTFMTNGVWVTADAYYADDANTFCGPVPIGWAAPAARPLLLKDHGGSVWLTDAAGTVIDDVCWSHNANIPVRCGTNAINLAAVGLPADTQVIRTSSPNFISNSFGRAYDSGVHPVDFTTMTVQYNALSTADGVQTIVAGVPAVGAVISANDGLSDPATAYAAGSPPSAVFTLPNVATGTWTVLVSSGLFVLQNDTVTLADSGSTYVYPSSTTFIDQTALYGFISGTVTDIAGLPISAPTAIPVSPGSAGANQNANTTNGRYYLVVNPGSVDVTANVANGNANYITISSLTVPVTLGRITNGVNFVLSQGGRLTGFVTRDGTNALPGVAINAIDGNGLARDTQVSDVNGRFTTVNIATGAYEVTPSLDSLETSTPTYISKTVVGGQTVFAGTFTVTGALGAITGSVSVGGVPIATGVLIVVTTATLSGTPPAPPALSTASLTGAPYYVASSLEDGTYRVDVRQSSAPASYRIYGYYTTLNSTGAVTFNSQTLTGVDVLAGQTVPGKNLAW